MKRTSCSSSLVLKGMKRPPCSRFLVSQPFLPEIRTYYSWYTGTDNEEEKAADNLTLLLDDLVREYLNNGKEGDGAKKEEFSFDDAFNALFG